MSKMYHTLMDLPLFKGAGEKEISDFLEKTSAEFTRHSAGSKIVVKGEQVKKVGFLLSGCFKTIYANDDGSIILEERQTKGGMIGMENMFGLYVKYPFDVTACEDCGIMQLDKEQLLHLLASNQMYLINILNYLSLQGQRPTDLLMTIARCSVAQLLSLWISGFTNRHAVSIRFYTTAESLARHTNLGLEEVMLQLKDLQKCGVASVSEAKIEILSRLEFLEYAKRENL